MAKSDNTPWMKQTLVAFKCTKVFKTDSFRHNYIWFSHINYTWHLFIKDDWEHNPPPLCGQYSVLEYYGLYLARSSKHVSLIAIS